MHVLTLFISFKIWNLCYQPNHLLNIQRMIWNEKKMFILFFCVSTTCLVFQRLWWNVFNCCIFIFQWSLSRYETHIINRCFYLTYTVWYATWRICLLRSSLKLQPVKYSMRRNCSFYSSTYLQPVNHGLFPWIRICLLTFVKQSTYVKWF